MRKHIMEAEGNCGSADKVVKLFTQLFGLHIKFGSLIIILLASGKPMPIKYNFHNGLARGIN